MAVKGEISYTSLRKEPTTIIGTLSCGATLGGDESQQVLSAGALMKTVMGYADMETVEPENDSLGALVRCIDSWLRNPVHHESRPMRSVQVFWNMDEYWTKDGDKYLLTVPTKHDDGVFTGMLQKLSMVGHQIYLTIFSGVADLHESL